jgi:uncharacterized membrane protein
MLNLKLYRREDCHLCDEALRDLDDLREKIPHVVSVIDIDGDRKLKKLYDLSVPVIEVGPYTLKSPFTVQDLEITLKAAAEREDDLHNIDQAIERGDISLPINITRADRFSYWIARHYMLALNLIVLIYLGLPFVAPVLMAAGISGPANVIYRAYSVVCHQLAFRSWFLFGDQPVYPRQAAGVDWLDPYGTKVGLSEEDLAAARQFTGNPEVGFKVALCERDVAIYGGILLYGVVFSLTNRHWKPLPWYIWLLIGIVPIGLDGFSQLLSQPPLSLFPYRESTPVLRTLTGFLFGVTTAWFGYPLVEETMVDIRSYTERKFKRVSARRIAEENKNALPPT